MVNQCGANMVGNANTPQALQVFKCLSDETRLMLVLLVAQEQELCVCEMTHALQESQPKVSRHLAQLRQCGLLSGQREGQWVYYRLAPQIPAWTREIIRAGAQGSAIQLAALTRRLTNMGIGRPGLRRCVSTTVKM